MFPSSKSVKLEQVERTTLLSTAHETKYGSDSFDEDDERKHQNYVEIKCDENENNGIPQQVSKHSDQRILVICMIVGYIFLLCLGGVSFLMLKKEITSAKLVIEEMAKKFEDLKSSTFETVDQLKAEDTVFMKSTDKSLRWLSQNYTSLNTDVETHNKEAINKISSLANELDDHNKVLTRLNNRTTNADVLDKITLLDSKIYTELMNQKADVSATLEVATKNVSKRMEETHAQLDKTVVLMKEVVGGATSQIYMVQSNVTQQLATMGQSLGETVAMLNSAVDAARTTIHFEVSSVKSDIEQYVAVTNKQFAAENDFVKYQLAGLFTLIACLIFLMHMTAHLRHNIKPDIQRKIMAVLWMVPIYSVMSWFSLVKPDWEAIFGAVRDVFEAYVVYTFIALLIAVLRDPDSSTDNKLEDSNDQKGEKVDPLILVLANHVKDERQKLTDWQTRDQIQINKDKAENNRAPIEHLKPIFPCGYVHMNSYSTAKAWLFQCRAMVMQFVLLKPFLTAFPFVLYLFGVDYDGIYVIKGSSVNWSAPKLYVMILQNISVAVAFYGLLKFYHGTEKELAWCDPWPKFLCIKGIVFITFWQGMTLEMMSYFGLTDERTASQAQNLLICVEMLIASLAHYYIFPYYEWAKEYKINKKRNPVFVVRDTLDSLALFDFFSDVSDLFGRSICCGASLPSSSSSSEGDEPEADQTQLIGNPSESTPATPQTPCLESLGRGIRTDLNSSSSFDQLSPSSPEDLHEIDYCHTYPSNDHALRTESPLVHSSEWCGSTTGYEFNYPQQYSESQEGKQYNGYRSSPTSHYIGIVGESMEDRRTNPLVDEHGLKIYHDNKEMNSISGEEDSASV